MNHEKKILLGISSDCVGPVPRGDLLKLVWQEAIDEHTMRHDVVGHFNLCEIPTFPGAYTLVSQTVKEMGLGQIGLHGKIGQFVGEYPGGVPVVHNSLDVVMMDEVGNKEVSLADERVLYQLVHTERMAELVLAEGEGVYRRLSVDGRLFMVENGPVIGSFEKGVEMVIKGNEMIPGGFGLMIDWLHLLKDVGGDVGKAEELALEVLGRTNFVFGEHGAFGERMDDSHSLDNVDNFRRLYQIGGRYIDRLLVRVIESQYNTGGYLTMDLGFANHIRQRNLQLIEFLNEELGWI